MKSQVTLHRIFYFLIIMGLCLPMQLMAADEEEVKDEAMYFELSPPFVVNLQDTGTRIRFLQARIQVLTRSAASLELVKTHNAPIRDALITLLSAQSREDINTSQKKKALQEEALKVVKNVLKKETGKAQVEGLYFTNFVVQ
jgi:flagellar FliL protein